MHTRCYSLILSVCVCSCVCVRARAVVKDADLSVVYRSLLYSDRNHGTVRNTRELVKVFAISRANFSRLKGIFIWVPFFIWVVSPFNFLEVLCYHIRAQGGCGLFALLASERSKPVGVVRI